MQPSADSEQSTASLKKNNEKETETLRSLMILQAFHPKKNKKPTITQCCFFFVLFCLPVSDLFEFFSDASV